MYFKSWKINKYKYYNNILQTCHDRFLKQKLNCGALWTLAAFLGLSPICVRTLLMHMKTSVRARWEEDLLDAFHPLLFLLCCWCWDAVEGVVSFHNPSICFSLTGFDHLILVVWDEEFKAVLCKESYFRRSFTTLITRILDWSKRGRFEQTRNLC